RGSGATLPPQLADRGDDGGGPAGEDLLDLTRADAFLPDVDLDLLLSGVETDLLGELEDRRTRDALEDRAGQSRSEDAAVLHDEKQVHPAELLDVGVRRGVEEDDLVTAVLDSLELRSERGRIVAATLRGARAALAGPGVLGRQPQRHRLQTAGEVCAGRGGDDRVGDLLCRPDAEVGLRRIHERAQVEAE